MVIEKEKKSILGSLRNGFGEKFLIQAAMGAFFAADMAKIAGTFDAKS